MNTIPPRRAPLFRLLFTGLLLAAASARGFTVTPHLFHTYWGDRVYPCMVIDSSLFPLVLPYKDATVDAGSTITITWAKDNSTAVIRPASKYEAMLLDLMGKPDAAAAWKKYIASTLKGSGYKYEVHDFQPDCLDVNFWHIGAISMDYSLGGLKSSSLLMIWRCKDGSTLTVTLESGADQFKAHSDEINRMIGGAILVPIKPPAQVTQPAQPGGTG